MSQLSGRVKPPCSVCLGHFLCACRTLIILCGFCYLSVQSDGFYLYLIQCLFLDKTENINTLHNEHLGPEGTAGAVPAEV